MGDTRQLVVGMVDFVILGVGTMVMELLRFEFTMDFEEN